MQSIRFGWSICVAFFVVAQTTFAQLDYLPSIPKGDSRFN